ncbi:LnmK family bifunctional acyltransferase/decarboxylase [Flavobacteriaceae bacterium M23B6Z8]
MSRVEERTHRIGMPQMNLSGLSENWLLKELGDFHWHLINQTISNNKSTILVNPNGDRIYPTFVRVHLTYKNSAAEFEENSSLAITGDIHRVGYNKVQGNFDCKNDIGYISARMLTAFAIKTNSNISLTTALPRGFDNVEIDMNANEFYKNYKIRKNIGKKKYESSPYSVLYRINPYRDINGVNLLYFASYPEISNMCECEVMNKFFPQNKWAIHTSLQERDIYYYGNCDINDKLIYNLENIVLEEDHVLIESRLYRDSDKICIAEMSTKKKVNFDLIEIDTLAKILNQFSHAKNVCY